jgi:predicted nucleic acid-binding protein
VCAGSSPAAPTGVKRFADTGIIVALLARDDPFHAWALLAFRDHAPFHTCDAVLAEAASFFPTPVPVLTLVARGDLLLDPDFVLAAHMARVHALCERYADRPMDLADACLVRMTEITRRCKVWTVDHDDFATYRRYGRDRIPCETPPSR